MSNYTDNVKFVAANGRQNIARASRYGWREVGIGLLFAIVIPIRYLYHMLIDPIFYADRVTQYRKGFRASEDVNTEGQA